RRRGERLLWVLFVAVAGVAAEWLSTFTPLPLNMAISQYRNLPLIQLAALSGIWGVSFLVWWLNAALADAVLTRQLLTSAVRPGAAFLLAALLFGTIALRARASRTGPILRVAAIQDHTGPETASLVAPGTPEAEGDRDALTREAVAQGTQLVVWS